MVSTAGSKIIGSFQVDRAKINAKNYFKFLDKTFLGDTDQKQYINNRNIFRQNNDPSHSAKLTITHFDKKVSKTSI